MPAIFLTQPPFVVDVGPHSGAYLSREAYEEHLKRFEPPTQSIFDQDPWLDEGCGG